MDNTIWELREAHRCIGARLVKIQNKRAVYGPAPAPGDPALFASEPFSALRTSRSGSSVSVGLVNELIEEMDLAVLALRLCCVKIEIEREGLRGLLPPVLESVAALGTGGDQEKEEQSEGQSLGDKARSSNSQSVVSMAERPHPLFPPQTQFRPLNSNSNSNSSSNRNSHSSAKKESAGVEQMKTMKEPVPGTTMELVFPRVETGVGGTVKDQARAPYENNRNNTTERGTQRGWYPYGRDDTATVADVERPSAAEKKIHINGGSRRQPAQAPAHPPPARTTSLALPRSKAAATRKATNRLPVVTNLKNSPDVVPPVPVSTPAPNRTTNKDKKSQDNGLHDEGDDSRQRDLGESVRRRHCHRQQVVPLTNAAHAGTHTQETQQQVKHQHRIGVHTGTGEAESLSSDSTTKGKQGHFDGTKGISTRPPTTSKYNKSLPGTRTHSPSPIINGKFVDSATSPSNKHSDHHHQKKRNSDIPNNMAKDRRQEKYGEEQEEEHTRASRERGGGGLQKEERSSSFLGTVKGAIKGVFNGTMA